MRQIYAFYAIPQREKERKEKETGFRKKFQHRLLIF